jgi:polyhydroxyalkanoate synthesis regulator phasin
MAQRGQRESKDLLTRLADAGEEAIQKLADVPGGRRVVDAVSGLRDRVDELQHRVRRVDELEKRVEALERKLAETRKPAARRRTTTRKTTAQSRAPRTPPQKP